jgi:hypothetical protein
MPGYFATKRVGQVFSMKAETQKMVLYTVGFSPPYWDHLTKFRLSTAWLFTNAIRIRHKLPEYGLALDKLGAFLVSLSGSGPTIYDGQTFSPDDYSA